MLHYVCTTVGLPADGHFGDFHALAAKDMGVQVSLGDCAFGSSGHAPRGGRPIFDFTKIIILILQYKPLYCCTQRSPVVHSLQQCTRAPVPVSPHPCQHVFFAFVIGALLMDFLVFISLMISDVECLFISLMAY